MINNILTLFILKSTVNPCRQAWNQIYQLNFKPFCYKFNPNIKVSFRSNPLRLQFMASYQISFKYQFNPCMNSIHSHNTFTNDLTITKKHPAPKTFLTFFGSLAILLPLRFSKVRTGAASSLEDKHKNKYKHKWKYNYEHKFNHKYKYKTQIQPCFGEFGQQVVS